MAVGQKTRTLNEVTNITYNFRTLDDAERLMQRLQVLETDSDKYIRVAVIGAGASGVELACKLANHLQKRGQVYLIDRRRRILRDFSFPCQKAALRALAVSGVEVNLNTHIQIIDGNRITLVCQQQTYTRFIDLLIWTIGTQNWEWLDNLDCQQNTRGQLLTRPTLQLLDYPEVFAVGDIAAVNNCEGKQVPATAQAAFQQAKTTARNLWASLSERPLIAFRYRHFGEMLTLGINTGVVFSFGICIKGPIAFIIRRWIYILRLPTMNHRLQVSRYWLIAFIKRLLLNSLNQ